MSGYGPGVPCPEDKETPDRALLPEASSALLGLGWERMAVGRHVSASPGCLASTGSAAPGTPATLRLLSGERVRVDD